MRKTIALITALCLIITLTACQTSGADKTSISAVYFIPESEDDYYEFATFAIGEKPFDLEAEDQDPVFEDETEYSPLDDMDGIQDYDLKSMVFTGQSVHGIPDEGVSSRWNHVSVYSENEDANFVDATCIYETEHAFFYLDDRFSVDMEKLEEIAAGFEDEYEVIRRIFGNEGDVDANGKIRFLITSFDEDTMGYYYSLDQYSQEELERAGYDYKSNLSDMLYINVSIFSSDESYTSADVVSTLCHEFSHMAYMNNRASKALDEEYLSFIVEGLAMWTEYYVGYPEGHDGYLYSYLSVADEISFFTSDRSEIYGYGLLFFRYFEERFGTDAIIRLANSPYTEVAALEDASGVDADTLFEDFVYTVLATVTGLTDSEYYMEGLNDAESGFELLSTAFEVLADKEYGYYLEKGESYYSYIMPPFSFALFFTESDPDFESDRAQMIKVVL